MKIDDSHWLTKVEHSCSPFFNKRVDATDISLLVIHNISLPPGNFSFAGKYIKQLFMGNLDVNAHAFFKQIATLQVSAHCVIYRDGTIEQFVPFNMRAWHAGVSSFKARANCNDFSIGIELEGSDYAAYTKAQYNSLIKITKQIKKRYLKITNENIVGHQHIAPSRKSDPGYYFRWDYYLSNI